uniref:Kinesinlike protein putative n=2 Tax=Albugo laibachii Nc14 TaxID=890382 RepID=F0W6H9_9STRA|nr:kinesinlike protein putative [Albugo laibachii Nc14]CCA21827.1 kinesinlike protein putative [Albugo laibachii Nc14]|eukprot:CCA21827.1 kinesinlike protein putative [Albugo laibachii Nc14]
MVDLAGSERLKKSDSDGQRLKEALHINSSLSAVGKVVMSLDPESGYNYIPYRDSKLTRLLQNSIGGNSITMLIATIHPMREHYEECLSTLQFANRCRSVQNQPRVNHINSSVVDKDRRIRKLNEEITSLRRQIGQMRVESSSRLLKALHVLGFDAQEVTEAGEIKFADGSVLHSVFDGVERANSDNQSIKSKVLLSNNRRVNGLVPGFHHNDLAKGRQKHLQEKYINAKDNFSALIQAETTKEKEKLEKTAAMQRSRIMELEIYIEQKQKEFRYALMQERATSQKEMAQLVANNHQLIKQSPQTKKAICESQRIVSKIDYRAQLTEQIARIEASKQTQIALLQEQCDQIVNAKKNEAKTLQSQIRQLEFSHSSNLEMIRMDCNELFDYIERLVRALQRLRSGQHATIPKNILADVTKLQHIKSLVLLHKHSARKKCWVREDSRGNNADRPFSAPVRRAKPPGFTSSLRERVRETAY